MKHKLVITPAIPPAERHEIEDILEGMGYNVWAGGTHADMSECDIAFESKHPEETPVEGP